MKTNIKIIIVTVVFLIFAFGITYVFLNFESISSNLALSNCIKKGGEIKNLVTENGETKFCYFSDNTICNAVDFFLGKCKQGVYHFCNKRPASCITLPEHACADNGKTYVNGCNACLDKEVIYWSYGDCPV